MPKLKSKPKQSPFTGRWRIVSMTNWDNDFMDEEVPAYIEFDAKRRGDFQFGYVQGRMDCRVGERDGLPEVEFTWDGNDEMDPAHGRGRAELHGDRLEGRIHFHGGDESGFTAVPFPQERQAKRVAKKA